jgi:carboxylesterase type B
MGLLSPSCVLPILFYAALGAAWNVGEEVKTSSGSVKGHASSWQPEVSEYLGIPFAQTPTGPLRFAAPVPFQGSGSIDAAKFVSLAYRR